MYSVDSVVSRDKVENVENAEDSCLCKLLAVAFVCVAEQRRRKRSSCRFYV